MDSQRRANDAHTLFRRLLLQEPSRLDELASHMNLLGAYPGQRGVWMIKFSLDDALAELRELDNGSREHALIAEDFTQLFVKAKAAEFIFAEHWRRLECQSILAEAVDLYDTQLQVYIYTEYEFNAADGDVHYFSDVVPVHAIVNDEQRERIKQADKRLREHAGSAWSAHELDASDECRRRNEELRDATFSALGDRGRQWFEILYDNVDVENDEEAHTAQEAAHGDSECRQSTSMHVRDGIDDDTSLALKCLLSSANRICASCRAEKPTYRCTRCRMRWYCSSECQSSNWSDHRRLCKTLAEQMQVMEQINSSN